MSVPESSFSTSRKIPNNFERSGSLTALGRKSTTIYNHINKKRAQYHQNLSSNNCSAVRNREKIIRELDEYQQTCSQSTSPVPMAQAALSLSHLNDSYTSLRPTNNNDDLQNYQHVQNVKATSSSKKTLLETHHISNKSELFYPQSGKPYRLEVCEGGERFLWDLMQYITKSSIIF